MTSVTGFYQTNVGRDRKNQQTLCSYRDLISTAEVCKFKCAIVSLDFDKAFDRINHQYLIRVMNAMSFPPRLVAVMRNAVINNSARFVINGQISRPIEVTSYLRLGCPMSMDLFAVAIEPLLASLTRRLQGLEIHGKKK
ncbi:uncharacterized protein LOC126249217 [Schistocerca nitens]|uniref:uncharacterized protein LOC126249217 n=1 Tax=Schistocerca nitens TaxID=7011 RepID=UPI0021176B4C|nr:uncharacterized protein LOC126249217 [Schistocerca nitens]